MSLMDKLKGSSVIKLTSVFDKANILNEMESVDTGVPALNIALSGSLKGGISTGITMFAGVSKSFKTMFSLICAKAYLDKYKDGVLIFYDSEMGASKDYFKSLDIDTSRVLYTPIVDVEELRSDIANQLESIERGDHVIIIVDSIGNLPSRKEAKDAKDQKESADMTRAKQLKSFTRIITTKVNLKNIPVILINHTYKTMEMISKDVVSGGTGVVYSSNQIFIITRRKEQETSGKDTKEISGWTFTINVEKSRNVKEKSKIPVTVFYQGGINKWSALLDIALESGHVAKPSMGWYQKVNRETGELEGKKYRERETNTPEFWESILADPTFNEFVEQKYRIVNGKLITDDATEIEDIEENSSLIDEE